MHRHLNPNGVKDSAGMWRTINGVRWPQWTTQQFEGQLQSYRNAGIRARRFGEEIFVHPDDQAQAAEFDRNPSTLEC